MRGGWLVLRSLRRRRMPPVVGARCGTAVAGGKTDSYGLLRTNTDCSCRQAANGQYAVCCLSSNVRLCPLRRKARQLPQANPSSLCYAVASNIASSWRVLASRSLKECTFVLDPASFHYAVTSRRGSAVRLANYRRRAILRGKVAFCKANKRGIRLRYTTPRQGIPLYVTRLRFTTP